MNPQDGVVSMDFPQLAHGCDRKKGYLITYMTQPSRGWTKMPGEGLRAGCRAALPGAGFEVTGQVDSSRSRESGCP